MAASKSNISRFTTITAVPRGISRQAVLDFLHSHPSMISLNTLVISHTPIPPPADTTPDERDHAWYRITDRVSYLPQSAAVSGKPGEVEYTAAFNNLPVGIQTHYHGPVGVDFRSTWSLNGFLPGEERQDTKQQAPEVVPAEGPYVREDVELRCSVLLLGFVRQKLNKSHGVLVARLAEQAKRAEMAAARKAVEERHEILATEHDTSIESATMMPRTRWTGASDPARGASQQPGHAAMPSQQNQQKQQEGGRTSRETPRCTSSTNSAAPADRNARRSFNSDTRQSDRGVGRDRAGPWLSPPAAYKTDVQPYTSSYNSNFGLSNVRPGHVRHGRGHDNHASLAQPSAHGPSMRPHTGHNHGHGPPPTGGTHGQHIAHRSRSSSVLSCSTASSSASKATSPHSKASSTSSYSWQSPSAAALPHDKPPEYAPHWLSTPPSQPTKMMATDAMPFQTTPKQVPSYNHYQGHRYHKPRHSGDSTIKGPLAPRVPHPGHPQLQCPQLQQSQLEHPPRLLSSVDLTFFEGTRLPSSTRAAPPAPSLSHSRTTTPPTPPTPPVSSHVYTPYTLTDGPSRKASNGDDSNPYPDPLRVAARPRPVLRVITGGSPVPGARVERNVLPQVPVHLRIGQPPPPPEKDLRMETMQQHQALVSRAQQKAVVDAWVETQRRDLDEDEQRRKKEELEAARRRSSEVLRQEREAERLQRENDRPQSAPEGVAGLYKAHPNYPFLNPYEDTLSPIVLPREWTPDEMFVAVPAKHAKPSRKAHPMREEKAKALPQPQQMKPPGVMQPIKPTRHAHQRLSSTTVLLRTKMLAAVTTAASPCATTTAGWGVTGSNEAGEDDGAGEQVQMSGTLSGPFVPDMPEIFVA